MTEIHCSSDFAPAGCGVTARRPGAPAAVGRRPRSADPTRVHEKLIRADHRLAGGPRILETLEEVGPACVRRLVLALYADLDPCLHRPPPSACWRG